MENLSNFYFKEQEDGNSIFFCEDQVKNAKANVLIVLTFGKTIHNLFLMTGYFKANRFNVYCFDPRNHVGFSTGIMESFQPI